MSASIGDLVGKCVPSAHVIPGLDLWHYVEFGLDDDTTLDADVGASGEPQALNIRLLITRLQELQSILMKMDILACVDRIDKRVWAFARTTVQLDVVTDSNAHAIALHDGAHPTVVHRGQLVTADLLRDAHGATMQAFKPNQAAQSAAQGDSTLSANLKTNEVAAKFYRLLILAIVETFSFRLCAYMGKFLPVAFGLLAVRPLPCVKDELKPESFTSDHPPLDIVRISPVLTVHGSLVVSTSRATHLGLFQVTAETQPGPIYIGPCGAWVYLSSGQYSSPTSSQQTAEDAFKGADGVIWRRRVQDFLSRRGFNAPDPDQNEGWTAIQISKASRVRLAWPTALCYSWSPRDPNGSDNEQWRQWYDTSATKDSFDDALDFLWMDQHYDPDTDAMQQDDEDMDSDFELGFGGIAQSPAFLRQPQFHDNTAAMIYPTPPDGMPLTAASDFSQDAYIEQPTQDRAHLMSDDESDPVDLSTHPGMQEESRLESPSSPTYADDLFGDGSDIPDEPDITDADFSFFDEGSLARALDATMTEIDQNQSKDAENDLRQADGISIDQEGEDISLDHIYNDVTMTAPSEKHVQFAEQETATRKSTGDSPLDSLQVDEPVLLAQHTEDGWEPSKSFSAVFMPDVVSNSVTDTSAAITSRPFNAVAFNTVMSKSDSKYAGQGRFAGTPSKSGDKVTRGLPTSLMFSREESKRSSPWKSQSKPAKTKSRKEYTGHRPSCSDDSSTTASDEELSDITDDENPSNNDSQSRSIGKMQSKESLECPSEVPHSTVPEKASEDIDMRTMILLCDYFDGYKATAQNGPPSHLLVQDTNRLQFATRQADDGNALQDIARVAQVVARSAGNAPLLQDAVNSDLGLDYTGTSSVAASSALLRTALTSTIEAIFSELGRIEDMTSYAVFDPTPILSSPRLGAPSPGAQSRLLGEAIFDIPAPYVRVSKTDDAWYLASTSIPFWDVLGLGPAHGNKNVIAHCIVPGTGRLIQAAEDFLQMAKSSYENSRLGRHRVGGLVTEFQSNGVIPSRATNIQRESDALGQIEETCALLANVLSRKGVQEDTLLVYIVNPFTSAEAFAGICKCCATLERRYHEGIGSSEETGQSKIISVIVPTTLVASDESPVFMPAESMAVFARNVYDRILAPVSKRSLAISTTHAIELEEPSRVRIPFELSEKPSADPLLEGCCMHVAYTTSSDGKWVTAAWTDDSGNCQDVSALCIEHRTFAEAAYELWLTTIEILRSRKVSWRLLVASGGSMSIQEQRLWLRLATMLGSPQAPVRATLTLLSVNVAPSLELSIPAAGNETNTNFQAPGGLGSYTTPTSTPGPLAASPHPTTPSMNAGTPTSEAVAPAADADSTARLSDITDESWGIILSHTLPTLADPMIYAPSRCSGYLAKRRSADDQDAPVLMEVNLIYCADKIKPGESALIRNDKTLRQVLVSYRGLSLLARLSGVQGSDSTVPWHIAVVRRGAEALAKGMVLPGAQGRTFQGHH